MSEMRVGQGWDRHRLVEGELMKLAGIEIDAPRGPEGFSDGDPLLHALIDALLGACGMGDIGQHFPSGNERWRDAPSKELLEKTIVKFEDLDWRLVNADLSVILEPVRLASHRDEMEKNIERVFSNDPVINIKFKTADELGPIGKAKAIEAQAVVLLRR
ncbi:MAG: 2-C-methyl-D-erythritol 2,4-cyclodiphosphate synthase [bacterium]